MNWRAMLWGFGGAASAILLYMLAATAWVDHQRVQALWDRAVQQVQAEQQRLMPPRPPAAPEPTPPTKR